MEESKPQQVAPSLPQEPSQEQLELINRFRSMDYSEQERFRMVWGNSAVPLIHRQQATPTNYVLAKAR